MPYLILQDYATYIQGDYLRQLTQGNDSKRVIEENTSIQAIAQRLTQKYDLNTEFTELLPYDKTKTYNAAQRVVLDISSNGFTAWAAAGPYAIGDLVIYNSTGYVCTANNTDATFTAGNWTAIAAQFTLFYGAYPSTCTVNGQPNPATLTQPYAPVFNYKTLYIPGDVVYWKGNTYVCKEGSACVTQQQALQYTLYTNIPFANVFPDDPVQNAQGQYWKSKTAYNIAAGTALTSNSWVRGDNRNQTIKDAVVRITVFKLSPLIAPKNRPDVWLDDYRSILRELNEAAEGKISMSLPVNQPQFGLKTSYGGDVKRQNNW